MTSPLCGAGAGAGGGRAKGGEEVGSRRREPRNVAVNAAMEASTVRILRWKGRRRYRDTRIDVSRRMCEGGEDGFSSRLIQWRQSYDTIQEAKTQDRPWPFSSIGRRIQENRVRQRTKRASKQESGGVERMMELELELEQNSQPATDCTNRAERPRVNESQTLVIN